MENEKLEFQTDDFGVAKSSIMLLEEYENFLVKKIKKHKGLPKYLRYLINKYASELRNEYPFEYRNTRKYQTRGLKYERIKFEIDGNTWMAYQILAFYLRVSMSYLFAIILKLDCDDQNENKKDFDKKKIVTGFLKKIQLNLGLFLENIYEHDYECEVKFKI